MRPPIPSEQPGTTPSSKRSAVRSKAQQGGLWMGSSIAIQAALGIAAQIFLGRWLTAVDFGVFALFLSSSFVFAVLATGGIRTALTQQPSSSTERMAPAAFRTAILLATGAATILALLSPAFAALFNEPTLVPAILVGALTLPLGSFAVVAIPLLQSRLEFRIVAVSMTVTAVVRYAVTLASAFAGLGAMSLVLGAVAGAATLSLSLAPATMSAMRRKGRHPIDMLGVVRMARWALPGDLAAAGSTQIDYFVLGVFAPTAVVGGYYFAFQLVARVGQLFLGVSRNVLFPVLAQIQETESRQIRGLYGGGTVLVLASGTAAALLIAAMPAVEQILWNGKWAYVVPAVALLASALPAQIALTAPEQLLKARGSFRAWTLTLLARGAGVAAVALAISLVTGDALTPTAIAAALAAFLVLEALLEMAVLSRLLNFSLLRYWKAVLPLCVWLVATGWIGALIVTHLDAGPITSGTVAGIVVAIGAGLAVGIGNRVGLLPSQSAS